MRDVLAKGRALRGVAAWIAACAVAATAGASLTVAFLLGREQALDPAFGQADWWVFTNLWRPLLIAGAILAPLLSAPFAVAAVWLIRRARWPRPQADMAAGVLCAYAALGALILVARLLGPMGD